MFGIVCRIFFVDLFCGNRSSCQKKLSHVSVAIYFFFVVYIIYGPTDKHNGVMQGECLSPTLFAVYINELE